MEEHKTTGWKKNQAAVTRRRKLLESTDKRKTMYNRYMEAGRRIQALANITSDDSTKQKASADAKHFFKMARKVK